MIHEEWSSLENLSQSINLKKGELIARKDEQFNKEIFVEKGIVRAFVIDDEGNEKNTAFFREGEFMSTSTLRTKDGKSLYNYQAMCDILILSFESEEVKNFLSQNKHCPK